MSAMTLSHPFTHYARSRQRCLQRIVKMRLLDAPPSVIRHEQLFLWAMRQMRATGAIAPALIPGWEENYRRFVAIHQSQGSA